MFKPLLTLIFFCFSIPIFAQNPSIRIDKVHSDNYCLGKELSIDVTITGTFGAGNKFTVVAYRNWDNPAQRWEYSAELRGNKLVTVLKDPVLANSQSFGIRVLSSIPQTETDGYYSFRALTNGSVNLTSRWGFTADTLNSTDRIMLALTSSPMSPGEVTLNTGDKFELQSGSDWTTPYTTVVTLPKTKEGIYSIKEARNVCGPLQTSGQVSVKVNAVDFIPVSISPEQPCTGSEVKVIFNTAKADFNANTKFKIRFATDNTYFDSYKYFDVPAVLTGKNELKAIFPDGINANLLNQGLYMGIVAENPSAVSINKALKIYAHAKPSFSLKSSASSINLGEPVTISSNPTGIPPFKITLTTGEVMEYHMPVSPAKTTQYQVRTFESGCGVIENPVQTPLTITLKPSLFLQGQESNVSQITYCEGQTVRMHYKAAGVNAQTSYAIEAVSNTNGKFAFPARVIGDSLEFVIPKNISQDPNNDYGNVYALRLVSSNPSLISPNSYAKIQAEPYMTLGENSQISVPFPSAIRMDYNLHGGGPYTAELADGSKQIWDHRNVWYYQYIRKDTTFRLSALSNQCFKSVNLPAFALKVDHAADTSPALFARLIKKDYCMGDSVEVELSFSGKFEAGNQFTLSYLRLGQIDTYPIQNLTKSGIYKIKLPERPGESYDVSLQLSSSLPRLSSETDRFYLGIKPLTPTISPLASKERPERLYLGESPRIVVSTHAYSTIRYEQDGEEKSILADHNGMQWIPLDLNINKVSEFKLKSVTAACGTYTGDITSYFFAIGYQIVLNNSVFSNWRCAGTDSEMRFFLEKGNAAPGTKFTLQISASGSPDSYTDLAVVTDSRLFKFVVPDLPAGGYYVRVRSSDNIYSEVTTILFGHAPVATFKVIHDGASSDSSAVINYGSKAYFNTFIDGNEPWGILYSDGEMQQSTSNYTHYEATITAPQTFSVNKVWNSCGYGTSTGSVVVKVKPVLELKKYPENAEAVICAGQQIQLDYEIKGAALPFDDYLVFSILGDQRGPIKLDSVNKLSGRIELKIPDDLVGQQFVVSAVIASFQISQRVGYQIYSSPDITLIGDNTITAGEPTILFIRANNSFAHNTAVELSDGSSHLITAAFPGGITQVKVNPSVTTTFTLKELKSACGVGRVSGSAVVTVEPKLAKWLAIERIEGLRKQNICNADTIVVHFNENGNPGANADYVVMLSDSTGKNFIPLPTSGQFSPVTAVVPAGIKQSSFYRVRLTSKDLNVSGSTFQDRLRIAEYAVAKVLTPAVHYQAGETVNVVIGLEGSAPFQYQFGDDNFYQHRSSARHSDTLRLTPVTPVATYKIRYAGNECGTGKIGDPSSFQIELITGTEPLSAAGIITFGPNPTIDAVTVQFENAAPRQIEILNVKGHKVYAARSAGLTATVNMATFPPGVYLFQISKKQKTTTYRIVKY